MERDRNRTGSFVRKKVILAVDLDERLWKISVAELVSGPVTSLVYRFSSQPIPNKELRRLMLQWLSLGEFSTR